MGLLERLDRGCGGRMRRSVELLIGLIFVVLGVLVLASEPIIGWFASLGLGAELWSWWPVLLLVLAAFFLLPALIGRQRRPVRAGMAVPGCVLAIVGGVFLYSSVGDRWSAWSYLWTAAPFSVGLGLYLAGWIADAPALKWIGSGLAGAAIVAFVVFAGLVGGQTFRVVGALAMIALGVALLAGGLAERLSRKSPA